jgi:hypothetical protein
MAVVEAEMLGQGLEVEMVADHHRDLAPDIPHVLAQDEIVKAIDGAGDKDGHLRNIVGKMKIPPHVEPLGQRRKGLPDLCTGDVEPVQFPFNPHEKYLGGLGRVLSGMHDVAVVLENKIRHRCHDPAAIGTREQQHGIGLIQFSSHLSANVIKEPPGS